MYEAKDINGWNCQHYAAFHGHLPVLQFFQVRHLPTLTNNSTSLLHIAVSQGHLSIVEYIFQAGKSKLERAFAKGLIGKIAKASSIV